MGEGEDIILTPTPENYHVEVVDTRPDSSPYTGPYATLHFGDGPPLSVPTALLERHPRLSSRCERDMSLHLEDIPGDSGHVLVYHLLTGMYQFLKPKGSSPLEKSAAEFATCVRVYAIAREYELFTLETLAKGEMERLGDDLPVAQLLDVVMNTHLTPRTNDAWLHNYLKSLIKPLMEMPPISLTKGPAEHSSQTLSLTSALLRVMIELWREKDTVRLGPSRRALCQYQEESAAAIPCEEEPASTPKPGLDHDEYLEAKTKGKSNSKERRRKRRAKEREEDQNEMGNEDTLSQVHPSNNKGPLFGKQPDRIQEALSGKNPLCQTECPFGIVHPDTNEKEKKAKWRRQGSEDHPQLKILQVSPFSPMGKFKDPNNTMDRHYQVQPYQEWMDMTRYNSFVLNCVKYQSEDFIFVANSSTIERQKNPDDVARILEIRASDEHHVYARVCWMYWPEELPRGTQDGKKVIQGRQWYHGANELIASNHMDVINVISTTAGATVNQRDETDMHNVQPALYWRQAFDVRSMELSPAELRCKCNRPENPDKRLFGCSNNNCDKWLHDECLIHEALMKTCKRLGTDKPHKSTPIKEEDSEGAKRPLSLSETGAAQTAEQLIDVKPEEQQSTIKLVDVENALPTLKGENRTVSVAKPKARGQPRKSEVNDHTVSKPYKGLFEGVILGDNGPPHFKITDLREIVTGGDKSWTEPLYCLICNHEIQ